tara:strand:+ start:1429 stop:1959 length:531 start_codon:yes stop_codon:yes gene_type:complete
MSIWTVISVASSVVGTLASMQQAQAVKAYYDAQARQAELQGRIKKVEAQENAALVLRRLNQTIATNIARSAAGNVSPFTGSVSLLNNVSTQYAISDYNLAKETGTLGLEMGLQEADMLRQAGETKRKYGYISALADAGTTAYNIRQNLVPKNPTSPINATRSTTYKNPAIGTIIDG